jgi:hypothetical protein
MFQRALLPPWRWRQHGPLKCWYPTTTLHSVTTQKIETLNITAVKASNSLYKIVGCLITMKINVTLIKVSNLQNILQSSFTCLHKHVAFHFHYKTQVNEHFTWPYLSWRCIGGTEVELHSFFDLGTRWRWVVSFTPWPLYPPGKEPLVSIG